MTFSNRFQNNQNTMTASAYHAEASCACAKSARNYAAVIDMDATFVASIIFISIISIILVLGLCNVLVVSLVVVLVVLAVLLIMNKFHICKRHPTA